MSATPPVPTLVVVSGLDWADPVWRETCTVAPSTAVLVRESLTTRRRDCGQFPHIFEIGK